ncbi:MAG: hypothetical protein ABIY56_08620 [Dokdonella sp.]
MLEQRDKFKNDAGCLAACVSAFWISYQKQSMTNLTHYPLLIFVISFVALWLAALLGRVVLRGNHNHDSDLREDFGTILAAALTLLGLIIAFSFSMATDRYDDRMNFEEGEANAIGTEYVRADLLPAKDGDTVRSLLRSYLDLRIDFYVANDDAEILSARTRTAESQAHLWSAILPVAAAQPTAITALAVSGMNDVLNAQGYAQAMFWNRIPVSAWCLIWAIAFGCNLLVGYGSRSLAGGLRLLPILPTLVATALMFIADIDAPRHGIIRVQPQNLMSLADSLRVQSTANEAKTALAE